LKLDAYKAYLGDAGTFLVPFHVISPTIGSLYVYVTAIPLSRVLNLILSFSLLEDLTLTGDDPSIRNIGGPDALSTIRNLTLMVCNEGDHLLVVALFGECSYTLGFLDVRYDLTCTSIWYLHPHR